MSRGSLDSILRNSLGISKSQNFSALLEVPIQTPSKPDLRNYWNISFGKKLQIPLSQQIFNILHIPNASKMILPTSPGSSACRDFISPTRMAATIGYGPNNQATLSFYVIGHIGVSIFSKEAVYASPSLWNLA